MALWFLVSTNGLHIFICFIFVWVCKFEVYMCSMVNRDIPKLTAISLHIVTIYPFCTPNHPASLCIDPDHFCKSVTLSALHINHGYVATHPPTKTTHTTSHSSSTPPYRPSKHHPSLWVMSKHMEVEPQLIRPATHVGHVGDCCTPQIFQQLNGLRQTTHQLTGVLAFWHAWS